LLVPPAVFHCYLQRHHARAPHNLSASRAATSIGDSARPSRWARCDRTGWAQSRKTRVVLLLTGVVNDGGWSQLAYAGLQRLAADPRFQTAYAEDIGLAQIQQVARGYSDDGFDLILGHGFEFSSALLDVAPDYPDRHYFVTSFLPQPKVPRNIMFINVGFLDAAYGAGTLAALISERRQAVGIVGGADDPIQHRMQRAFAAGAQRAVPGIKALGIITGDYDNAAKGREAAATLIGNGADVLWHTADVTGLGMIQGAVHSAAAGKVKVLGCYSDQTALAPASMAASFEINLAGMVTDRCRMGRRRHLRRWHRMASDGGQDVASQGRGERRPQSRPRLRRRMERLPRGLAWPRGADDRPVGHRRQLVIRPERCALRVFLKLSHPCRRPALPPAIEMRGIVKRFPGVLANDRVDLTVQAGEIHALLGENGAGKSTLMQILYGSHRKDAGEILIEGRRAHIESPKDAIALGIGMVHQESMLVGPFTVVENTILGLKERRGPWLDRKARRAKAPRPQRTPPTRHRPGSPRRLAAHRSPAARRGPEAPVSRRAPAHPRRADRRAHSS
jgi:basic membrane protein A